MTSENVQYPIGTIVREYHTRSRPEDTGTTTWVLVEDHETVGGKPVRMVPTWLALFSDALGNLSQVLNYDELPLEHVEKIGVIPGTPAEREEQLSLDKVVKGDYPRLTMGTKPDGSPWVVHAEFGSGVAINSTGDIWDNKRVITPAQADRKSTALRDAMAWVVNDLVSVVEANKSYQLAKTEKKRKPGRVRIGVDFAGWICHYEPRPLLKGGDPLPWLRARNNMGEPEIRSAGDAYSRLVELTDVDTITVTATNTTAVAAFLDGRLVPGRHTDDVAGVEIGREYIGLWVGSRIWKTKSKFYILREGANLTIPVAR